ncbi:hypothetical protein RN616_13555 [Morganella morganii]|uniref:hypothetical protein n=1 Tax=Morganella morganii TaxID=582 RepID=UPI0028D797FC|nr:hypothetical protein [Morganella morganii]WNP29552.1 hypothetical protein RN616_13555 [Morganella morganii]
MEITSDQKRTICALLAEQAGHQIRSAEIAALCDDETIRAALLILSSLVDIKYREITVSLSAAQAEYECNNPQMMMGCPLSDSTLSAPAETPDSPSDTNTDTVHSAFFAAEPEPLILSSDQEAPVITDDTVTAPQSASEEEQASAEIDRLSSIFGPHAFLTGESGVAEPLNYSADDIVFAGDNAEKSVVPPAADNTDETTALAGSVFSDTSLFPEPVTLSDPLKDGNWLFDDLDTDETDTPVIGELPEPEQPQIAAASAPVSEPVPNHDWSFNTENNPLSETDPEEYLSSPATEQKPWGLTALFAAGKKESPPPAAPDTERESAGNTPVAEKTPPENTASGATASSPGQPAIRVSIARARLLEPFSSPVTATLDDGKAVAILGIYFRRNIGLSFNDKTGNLHGTPTEYGEFPVRVVWELAPKKRFSSDIHFTVDPGSHSVTPSLPIFPPVQ